MKRLIPLMALVVGCHGPVMTPCVYDEAQIGDCIQEVTECSGKPYCVRECSETGLKEYVYLSRNEVVPNVHQHRNWVFVVDAEGCIVDKYICDDEFHEQWFLMHQNDFDGLP